MKRGVIAAGTFIAGAFAQAGSAAPDATPFKLGSFAGVGVQRHNIVDQK
jgi:hypothetical protein